VATEIVHIALRSTRLTPFPPAHDAGIFFRSTGRSTGRSRPWAGLRQKALFVFSTTALVSKATLNITGKGGRVPW